MSETKPIRMTRLGKPDGRSTSSKKNISKARLVVKDALKKTFHPNEDVSSSDESDTEEEYEAIPVNPKKKQPKVEVEYYEDEEEEEKPIPPALQKFQKDLTKSKQKNDINWETKLQEELRKQEDTWNNRMKENESKYLQSLKETEDKYIKAKIGTIHNLRKSMLLKF